MNLLFHIISRSVNNSKTWMFCHLCLQWNIRLAEIPSNKNMTKTQTCDVYDVCEFFKLSIWNKTNSTLPGAQRPPVSRWDGGCARGPEEKRHHAVHGLAGLSAPPRRGGHTRQPRLCVQAGPGGHRRHFQRCSGHLTHWWEARPCWHRGAGGGPQWIWCKSANILWFFFLLEKVFKMLVLTALSEQWDCKRVINLSHPSCFCCSHIDSRWKGFTNTILCCHLVVTHCWWTEAVSLISQHRRWFFMLEQTLEPWHTLFFFFLVCRIHDTDDFERTPHPPQPQHMYFIHEMFSHNSFATLMLLLIVNRYRGKQMHAYSYESSYYSWTF